jgi:hypothetical protein
MLELRLMANSGPASTSTVHTFGEGKILVSDYFSLYISFCSRGLAKLGTLYTGNKFIQNDLY